MSLPGPHGFHEYPAHLILVFRVDFGKRVGAHQSFGIAEQRAVGGAVVEASPFQIQHRNHVADILGDQAEEGFLLLQRRFRLLALGDVVDGSEDGRLMVKLHDGS